MSDEFRNGGASRVPSPLAATDAEGEVLTLPLHAEAIVVGKRTRAERVRATRTTKLREAVVDETLNHEHVVVERVPVGRVVEAIPPVRQEGDVTIMPVVEEVLVVEKRLVLKEELHLRRVRSTKRHTQTVVLREQHVEIERKPVEPG